MTHIIFRVLIFQIDISPDTGNVEMKQQAGERLTGFKHVRQREVCNTSKKQLGKPLVVVSPLMTVNPFRGRDEF